MNLSFVLAAFGAASLSNIVLAWHLDGRSGGCLARQAHSVRSSGGRYVSVSDTAEGTSVGCDDRTGVKDYDAEKYMWECEYYVWAPQRKRPKKRAVGGQTGWRKNSTYTVPLKMPTDDPPSDPYTGSSVAGGSASDVGSTSDAHASSSAPNATDIIKSTPPLQKRLRRD
ncbi:hypothetical protein DFH28DRAFT_1129915 [Melampsora americana]|nr:hypothetical protein DFH28DRAFT_1129915 [Melampsora americana]